MSKTIAQHAAMTVDGRTVDALLAFHRATFGDARMSNDDSATGAAGTGAGDAGAGAGAASGATGTGGTGDAGTGAQGGQGAPTWNPDAWDGKVESLPAAAQKIITDARKEAGDERIAKKTLDAIQKALNPDAQGEKLDPAKLAADVTAKDATIRDLTIRSALSDALHTLNAKPIARAAIIGDNVLKDLDPAADDFTSKVNEAVKAYLEKNPELKTARVAGQSSVDHAGGSGEGRHDLDAQIAEAEKAGKHALAISLKRQRAYAPQST